MVEISIITDSSNLNEDDLAISFLLYYCIHWVNTRYGGRNLIDITRKMSVS